MHSSSAHSGLCRSRERLHNSKPALKHACDSQRGALVQRLRMRVRARESTRSIAWQTQPCSASFTV
jgi:hypothetical protein